MRVLLSAFLLIAAAGLLLAQDDAPKPAEPEKDKPAAEEEPAEPKPTQEQIDAAVRTLSARFVEERKEARKTLIRAGEEAVKPLLELLKNEQSALRAAAVEILGFIGGEAAAPEIVKLIKDGDLAVREEARRALARIGPAAVKYLAEALDEGTEEQRREFQIAVNRMVETIIKNLVGRDPAGNPEYGDYPGQFNDLKKIGKYATPMLAELATKSEVNAYRFLAVTAMGRLGDKSAMPTLKKLFEEDSYVRDEAAISLAQLGDDSFAKKVVEEYNLESIRNPENAYTYTVNLALFYHKLESWKDAEAQYKRAIELGPDQDGAYYNYACLLSVRGRTKEALEALKKSIENGYDSPGWMMRDGELENVRKLPEFKELFEKHFGKAAGAE